MICHGLLGELCYLGLLCRYLFLEFLYLLVVSVSVVLQLLFQGSLHLEKRGGRAVVLVQFTQLSLHTN